MEQEKVLKVSITDKAEVYIADMKVELDSFDKIFKSLWDGEQAVVINADEAIAYGFVMKVVSAVQQAGVKKLGFLTLSPTEKLGNDE